MRISSMAVQAPANTNDTPGRSRAQIWAEREKERRIYALSNKSFADRMAAMNADRVWTPGN